MCYVCCKELKGWFKSFTRTEGLLSILEAVLLVVLIGFLVFLILHFVACRKLQEITGKAPNKYLPTHFTAVLTNSTAAVPIVTSTLSPDVECTWEPSQQTSAATRYYLTNTEKKPESRTPPLVHEKFTTTESLEVFGETLKPSHEYDDVEFLEPFDGENADDIYKRQVVALVKLKTPGDPTFGCTLTKITRFWTLTAASCIESIEEVDSLDSFVIVEEFGEARAWRTHGVADVRVHPYYRGANRSQNLANRSQNLADRSQNLADRSHDLADRSHDLADRSYDLAALRSDRALRAAVALRLPHALDYFLVAVGERFFILGYGGYRSVDKSATGRRLRQVSVFVVSSVQCGAGGAGWSPRHLAAGGAARAGACGAGAVCAGARAGRGAACHYCAGAPLLRAGTLYGVMSDNAACAVACEPQLYVNIASLRDWIQSLIE